MGTRFGFVSTYPPTRCGLATFTASLNEALTAPASDDSIVVRLIEDGDVTDGSAAASGELRAGDREGVPAAAALLNTCDVAIVQHAFGVYGGRDGDDVLQLLSGIRVPIIVVLHTVVVAPSWHQREVLEAVMAAAAAVVVMTGVAQQRLRDAYAVDLTKVSIIPHGAAVSSMIEYPRRPDFRHGSTVLTWGLLGPGKGIEWAIDAMALLADLRAPIHYVIAGRTHPRVLAHSGEAYRDALSTRIDRLGLHDTVRFDPHYRDAHDLAHLVASADVIVLPYDSIDQVTSGVLVEAVAAGKPVVATAFPHAVELLADGTGTVVAHRDPRAIADALRTIVTRDDVARSMNAKASATAAGLRWPAIAERYRDLALQLVSARVAA